MPRSPLTPRAGRRRCAFPSRSCGSRAPGRDAWGINAARFIQRRNESDWLQLVPKKENGLASRMAHLTGVQGIESTKQFEAMPYTVARAEFVAPDSAGDPFNDGSRAYGGLGVDLKYGITSNFTLNAAINPDFGQVEVDPAVVNLSAFETFYEEKRPFFIEGSQIFGNFGRSGSNSFWGFNSADPTIFYSRRIGRAPQGSIDAPYIDQPTATTILGAAKMTGKTSSGWTVGVLNAVTAREYARIDGADRDRAEVEPLTNYFVGRVQREAEAHRFRSADDLGAARLARSVFARAAAVEFAGGWRRRTRLPRFEAGLGRHRQFFGEPHCGIDRGDHAGAGSLTPLLPTARRLSAGSDRDVAVRLGRANQPQSEQRRVDRERGVVGRQPGIRLERCRLHVPGWHSRNARCAGVAETNAGSVQPSTEHLGLEVLHLGLEPRSASRRRS